MRSPKGPIISPVKRANNIPVVKGFKFKHKLRDDRILEKSPGLAV